MSDQTKIEWTDATWNPITGCTMVSAGCTNCYAMGLAGTRLRDHPSRKGLTRETAGRPVWTGEVRLNEQWLDQPLRWRRPRRIFVCAHGDLFHEAVPDAWIDRVFAVMARSPTHSFQVLTKRPARMRDYLTEREDREIGRAMDRQLTGPHPAPVLTNVWIGTSVEDQLTADARIPHLLETPAAVRFVSAEPLLGPVDLECILTDDVGIYALSGVQSDGSGPSGFRQCARLDWVIVGGESGKGARPMHPDWARSLRDQCARAGVAFHFKQWGAHAPASVMLPHDHLAQDADVMLPAAKARAGRLLDGVQHDGMPKARD